MDRNDSKTLIFKPLRRILQLLKLERKEITAIYFFAVLNGLIQLSLPLGIQAIVSFFLAATVSTSMVILIALVVAGVAVSGFLQVNQMNIVEKIQQRIFARFSLEMAWRLPKLDMQALDSYYLPEQVNRFFDIFILQKGISKLLLDIPLASIQIAFGLILLSFYNPIFIVFGLLLLGLLTVILWVTSKRGMATSIRESDYKYEVAAWLEEVARTVRSFKFSRNTLLALKKADKLTTGYINARSAHFRILKWQYGALIIFKVIITAGMLIVGAFLLVTNQLNIGQFIAAEIVILTVLAAVEKFILSLDKVYDILTSVEKLGKVLEKPLEADGGMEYDTRMGGMRIDASNLHFGYSIDRKVLHDIDFSIAPGEKLCVMGEDGSGKSTLIRLLSGAYPHFSGTILVNGLPITSYHTDSLRSHTGILFGQQDIFEGTVLENITLLNKEEVSQQQVMDLAKQIGLNDFLASKKDGLQTHLDPTGKRLSGSVIRKLLLLRALIFHPNLLLLEEPWLGMTNKEAEMIKHYLLKETGDATVLVASNDLDFANKCDKVMKLAQGRLVAFGTPAQVLN